MAAPPTTDTRVRKSDNRAAMEAARRRDKATQQAFESGQAGEKLSFGEGEEHLRDAHRKGLDERAADRRRRVVAQTGGYLARAGRSVVDRSGEIPTPSGGGSVVGVLVGVLAVVALFLLLTKSSLTSKAVSGLFNGVVWLIAPSVLPF